MHSFLNDKVKVITGDITTQTVDVIVNAANSSLMGGGGVDGAIHRAGGSAILDECKLIRKNRYPGGLPTGEAVITSAGNIKAKGIIHTVGPIYSKDRAPEKSLANCYINSLKLLTAHKYKSIAFPAISTGVFGYPAGQAAKVVSTTIKRELENFPYIELILLVFFSEQDTKTFLDNQEF